MPWTMGKNSTDWKKLGQDFVDGIPLISGFRGAAKLNDGDYLDSANDYALFSFELSTPGLASKFAANTSNLFNRLLYRNAAKTSTSLVTKYSTIAEAVTCGGRHTD